MLKYRKVSTNAGDCLERLISDEMTSNVSSEM